MIEGSTPSRGAAEIAQLVEHRTENAGVAGAEPALGTRRGMAQLVSVPGSYPGGRRFESFSRNQFPTPRAWGSSGRDPGALAGVLAGPLFEFMDEHAA